MNSTSTEFVLKEVHSTTSSTVLVVEALRKDERCTESFNEQQMIVNCEKHFLYGNILLFFIDFEGEIRQVETIEKMQHSVDRINPFYSFKSYNSDDKIIVCYNVDQENLEQISETSSSKTKPLSKLSRAKMDMRMYSLTGAVVPLKINRGNEAGVLYFPTNSQWLSSSELMLYSQKEKNYKFGTLLLH